MYIYIYVCIYIYIFLGIVYTRNYTSEKSHQPISTIEKPATSHHPIVPQQLQRSSREVNFGRASSDCIEAEGYLGNANNERNGKINLGPKEWTVNIEQHWAWTLNLFCWGFGIWWFHIIAVTIVHRPHKPWWKRTRISKRHSPADSMFLRWWEGTTDTYVPGGHNNIRLHIFFRHPQALDDAPRLVLQCSPDSSALKTRAPADAAVTFPAEMPCVAAVQWFPFGSVVM